MNDPNPDDPIDVLAKVGGFEFGAMAGVILEAYWNDCVVILDGFNTAAAALIANLIEPEACDRAIASHIGREIGHAAAIEHIYLEAMFKLDLALGEAIGSSIAAHVLDRIVYIYVCEDGDDFHGDLSDFKEDDTDEEALVNDLLDKIGLSEITSISSIDELEDYFVKNFDGDIHVEEVNLDFQLSDDQRLEPFDPPFSVNDFNVPRSFPMMIREMGDQNGENLAATEKTFSFYLSTMPNLHYKAMERCREYLDTLTKPRKSLGFLEDIAAQFAGITNAEKPSNRLRHAALAFTNVENSPRNTARRKKSGRRNVSMDFSMTSRTFAKKVFMGIVDPRQNPNVAFNFGRTLAEEISFSMPVIALTELSDWELDRIDERFASALLKKNGDLKVDPENFLSHVPKKFQCLTGALIGAMIAAAHNSTLIVVDCGAVEIVARYLEKLCPQIRPFILHAVDLINYDFEPGEHIGFDGEIACIGAEIVEAALTALNDMKTFDDTGVAAAVDSGASEGKS